MRLALSLKPVMPALVIPQTQLSDVLSFTPISHLQIFSIERLTFLMAKAIKVRVHVPNSGKISIKN